LAFFVSRSFVSPSRNRCLLSAPTLAKAIIHTGTLPSTSISLGVA
jgi:hypothetical protein